jgi:hypothetical protein
VKPSRIVLPIALAAALTAGMPGLVGAAEDIQLGRYKVIVDRNPFGGVEGPAPVVSRECEWCKRYVLVGLVSAEGSGQLQAVVHDSIGQKVHFVRQGDLIEDIEVISIELSPPRLMLKKGFEEGLLEYREAPAVPAAPAIPRPSTPTGPTRVPVRLPSRGSQ